MNLFGVRVDSVSFSEALSRVVEAVEEKRQRPFFVVTPNPEQIVEAQGNEEFRDALNAADLAIPDGWGVVVASRLLNQKHEARISKHETISNFEFRISNLPGRVSGIELFEALVGRATQEGWRVMLVGGRGETARLAAQKLKIDNGQLRIKGIEGLSDAKNVDREEESKLIEQINQYKPELLFVGFGAPEQELFVMRNRSKLKVKLVVVVGGTFDQIANPSLRPPTVIDRMGLGWLYRLVRQPWRLRRQLRLLMFAWIVFKAWLGGNQVSVDT